MHCPYDMSRRTFLASAAAAGGVIALPAYAASVKPQAQNNWTRIQANVRAWADVEMALLVLASEIAHWSPRTVTAMGDWPTEALAPTGFHLSFRGNRSRELVVTNAAALPNGIAITRENGPTEFVRADFTRQPRRTGPALIKPWRTAARIALQTGHAQSIG